MEGGRRGWFSVCERDSGSVTLGTGLWTRSETHAMSATCSGLTTRASLVLRLRDRADEEAWVLFTRLYGPFLFRTCRRAGLRATEAADATQAVFFRVFRYVKGFDYDPDRGRFRDWLRVLVRNEVAAQWARRQVEPGPTFQARARGHAAEDGPVVAWEDDAWVDSWAPLVHRLALERTRLATGKRSWVLFKLTWLVGCPTEKVARRFHLSVARVYEAKCRTLRRYREQVLRLAEEAAGLVPG